MRNHRVIRTIVFAAVVAAALPGLAFNSDKPGGAKFFGEQSQNQVASQQALNGKFNEVGTVEQKVSDESVNGEVNGDNHNASFSNADAAAKASLSHASTTLANAKNGSFPWLTLSLLCGFGILGAVAFKSYADKVPLPDSLKSDN